jgi:hypothetical protein
MNILILIRFTQLINQLIYCQLDENTILMLFHGSLFLMLFEFLLGDGFEGNLILIYVRTLFIIIINFIFDWNNFNVIHNYYSHLFNWYLYNLDISIKLTTNKLTANNSRSPNPKNVKSLLLDPLNSITKTIPIDRFNHLPNKHIKLYCRNSKR